MFPIRIDNLNTALNVKPSDMSKDIQKNKQCWVQGCKEPQNKNGWLCDKHEKESIKGKDLKIGVPTYSGNNPNIPK